MLTRNDWESEFFGIDIWECGKPREFKPCKCNKRGIITSKVISSDYKSINNLNASGFEFSEGEVELTKTLNKTKVLDYKKAVARNDEIEQLLRISAHNYINTRFRPPWFSFESSSDFYDKWVENALLTDFQDEVLVTRNGTEVTGFITLKVIKDRCKIGLLGVKRENQGNGVGSQLLKLAESYALAKKNNFMTVSTQASNYNALKLYQKNCYVIYKLSYWFYKDER